MITIDDEIVTFSDYENVLSTMSSYSNKSSAAACLDKIAETLLKLQKLWEFQLFGKLPICTLIMTPLTLIAPLFTILCYTLIILNIVCYANNKKNRRNN